MQREKTTVRKVTTGKGGQKGSLERRHLRHDRKSVFSHVISSRQYFQGEIKAMSICTEFGGL